jgi:SAM-dependent methyltransferase
VEPREYDVMRAVEDEHWWYRSLHGFVRARLGGASSVLDVGCGTGGLLALLPRALSAGVDVSPAALAHARGRGLASLTRASACSLPFADGSFDAVLALDLLYHRDVGDEATALAECRRVVRPGGRVMVHAAAYRWLYGSHDRAVHGARRYTASRVRELVAGAGLDVVELTYRNAVALPWAVVTRCARAAFGGLGRPAGPERSQLRLLPAWLNGLLGLGARAESAWLGLGVLPAGLSVWCVGRRP